MDDDELKNLLDILSWLINKLRLERLVGLPTTVFRPDRCRGAPFRPLAPRAAG